MPKLKIRKILLPYISPTERLLVAVSQPLNRPAWYYGFLADPITFLLSMGADEVIVLYGDSGEGPLEPYIPETSDKNRESPLRVDFNKLEKVSETRLEEIEKQEPGLAVYKEAKLVSFRKPRGTIVIYTYEKPFLAAIPFVKTIDKNVLKEFEMCAKKILDSEITTQNLARALRNRKLLKELKKCYHQIRRDINYTTLALLLEFTGTNKPRPILYPDSCLPCFLSLPALGVMLTGDLPIRNNKVFKEFSTYYAKHLEHFLIYQIPHHGGKQSHHPDLNIHAYGVVSHGAQKPLRTPTPRLSNLLQPKTLQNIQSNRTQRTNIPRNMVNY